jgi:hypothetical protein
MSLRRAGSLVLVLALAACKSATQEAQPPDLVFATFSSPNIPSPNDLILAQIPANTPCSAVASAGGGQGEFLCTFVKANGWPNDMELPISIPLSARRWDPTPTTAAPYGHYADAAPPTVNTNTVTASTVALYRVDGATPVAVAYDAVATPGLLTLRKQADPVTGRRWAAGARYAVAVRGGPSGVKTTTGLPISADSAVALVIPNKDLTLAENQPLGAIPDSNGNGTSADEIASLEALRAATWLPLTWSNATGAWTPAPGAVTPAFTAINAAFPYAETAVIATFGTAPDTGPVVLIDSGSGTAPLPIDLLRTSASGNIDLNAGFGAFGPGLTTLDGFSTTAMVLAQTSVPVDTSTVNGANVFLYKLTKNGAGAVTAVTRLGELKHLLGTGGNPLTAAYVAEPPPIVTAAGGNIIPGVPCAAAGGCSPIIGLQPAAGFDAGGGVTVSLPPLAESTSYAVVVTNRVKDMLGRPLVRPTVGKIVLDFSKILKADGVSSDIPGVGNATAKALHAMQLELAPIWAPGGLPTGTTKADVVTAYTFKTQSVTTGAAGVLAFAAGAAPTSAAFYTPAQIGAAYGVNALAAFPGTSVAEFAEVQFNTMNLLISGNPQTQGAFDLAGPTPEPITALVALPDPALVTGACPGGFTAAKCAPLVVFRHGIPRGKGDMLPIASALAAKGFVVAAIDAEKMGDRTYCGAATQAAADQQCFNPAGTPASTCVADAALKTSTDTGVVGRCSHGLLRKRVDCQDADLFVGGVFNPACYAPKGVPLATGNFIFTLNLFRMRDTIRQDVIDEAALVNALAPAAPRAAGTDAFATHLLASSLAVNPDQVYFASLSMGSENATLSVAVNPRFKKGAFNAGFATIVDVSANPASSDHAVLLGMLSQAGIAPGSADYLLFVQLAKWILDPADAANYAPLIQASGKPVLSQLALCDPRIPNAQAAYFTGLLLGAPVMPAGTPGTGFTQWFVNSASSQSCPADLVAHGFLVDPSTTPLLTAKAQASFADFLDTSSPQLTTVRP